MGLLLEMFKEAGRSATSKRPAQKDLSGYNSLTNWYQTHNAEMVNFMGTQRAGHKDMDVDGLLNYILTSIEEENVYVSDAKKQEIINTFNMNRNNPIRIMGYIYNSFLKGTGNSAKI